MPILADDVQTLHDYAEGVMTRAGHHAPQISAIALAILGGIIWRVEPGSIEIKQYDGDLANVLWWTSGATARRYACAYNHNTGEIEIRDRSIRGQVLHSFTNATPVAGVEQIFQRCKRLPGYSKAQRTQSPETRLGRAWPGHPRDELRDLLD